MKYLLVILTLIIVGCQSNPKIDTQNDIVKPLDTVNNDKNINLSKLTKSLTTFNADTIKFFLTENTIRDNDESFNLEEVDESFYFKYIQGNSDFRQRLKSDNEYYNDTKHYYYGKIDSKSSNHLIIIYEYFIVNHSEDKLILISIDDKGEFIENLQIAELTYYPGATQYISSEIIGNKINIINRLQNYQPDFDTLMKKNIFYSDSIYTTYQIKLDKGFRLIRTDTFQIEKIDN